VAVSVRGIGVDICKVERIAGSLERFGERMRKRLPHLAARFAAKEATSKALGTGMAGGVGWTQIEVLQPGGRVPELRLSGVALERFQAIGARSSHLTLSHDGGMAVACVVLEG
jgi:holo-[acyl-carrier protein] synthase